MTELLTAAQMRALEQAAMASGRASGLELMERAGRAVATTILDCQNGDAALRRRALVLCGPGNNGGDGFVIARHLKARGWDVETALFGMPEKCPPDARVNLDRWAAQNPVTPLPFAEGPRLRGGTGVIVDALFGTGLTRPLGPELARGVLARLEGPEFERWLRVAVDIPSGVCADSGRVLVQPSGEGAAFRADLTVTFHARKLGHVLAEGPALCGRVEVADIGLAHDPEPAGEVVRLVTAPPAGAILKQAAHKYQSGHALVLAGGAGRTGAARLAARAALRIGAGLVTLGAPGASFQEIACQITALMLRRVEDGAALSALLEDRRINALCLGPGLGLARARALVPAALAARRASVLDADALTAFADAPEALFEQLHPDCVLTPHGGEFARLFPDLAERLASPPLRGPAFSRVDAAREAAARAGCVVLFKGPDTVIAAPDGTVSVHAATGARVAPGLATAGSGDVLAGFIAGLMAQGRLGPKAAAEAAAWLHVECARAFGPGLVAEDLPEMLPAVLRSLCAPAGRER